MKNNILKLDTAILLTRDQLKIIGGNGLEEFPLGGGSDGGNPNTCKDACAGDWDCSGVNWVCDTFYCNRDGTGGTFKQCGPY